MTTQQIDLSEWTFWLPIAFTISGIGLFILSRFWTRAWFATFTLTISGVTALTVASPFIGWWLPAQGSSFSGEVDNLFLLIMLLTGLFFLLTEGLILFVLWNHAPKPGTAPLHIHGDHRLELIWTVVPGILLALIAVIQMPTWARMKGLGNESWLSARYESGGDKADLLLTVQGRQWEWRVRYRDPSAPPLARPLEWATHPEPTDLHAVNEVHAYPGAKVRLLLRTQDVIHSFFVPELRLKQDMLPGRTVPTWFIPTVPAGTSNETRWEIACAELCGGNHYRMRGHLVIHPDKASFETWYSTAAREQSRRSRPPETGPLASKTN